MGVAGHHHVFVSFGESHKGLLQPAQIPLKMLESIPEKKAKIKCNLVVPASPGMKLPPKWPDKLRELTLNAHVHIFVFDLPLMVTSTNGFSNAVKPFDNRLAFTSGEHLRSLQGFTMGDTSFNVVLIKTTIKPNGSGEGFD